MRVRFYFSLVDIHLACVGGLEKKEGKWGEKQDGRLKVCAKRPGCKEKEASRR